MLIIILRMYVLIKSPNNWLNALCIIIIFNIYVLSNISKSMLCQKAKIHRYLILYNLASMWNMEKQSGGTDKINGK